MASRKQPLPVKLGKDAKPTITPEPPRNTAAKILGDIPVTEEDTQGQETASILEPAIDSPEQTTPQMQPDAEAAPDQTVEDEQDDTPAQIAPSIKRRVKKPGRPRGANHKAPKGKEIGEALVARTFYFSEDTDLNFREAQILLHKMTTRENKSKITLSAILEAAFQEAYQDLKRNGISSRLAKRILGIRT